MYSNRETNPAGSIGPDAQKSPLLQAALPPIGYGRGMGTVNSEEPIELHIAEIAQRAPLSEKSIDKTLAAYEAYKRILRLLDRPELLERATPEQEAAYRFYEQCPNLALQIISECDLNPLETALFNKLLRP